MSIVLILLTIFNIIGFLIYVNYICIGIPQQKQMIVDFICPFGSIIARLIFKFDIKTNSFAYIYGLVLELIIIVISFFIFMI